MASNLELVVKSKNECIISGLFTLDYINAVVIMGNDIIAQSDTPDFDLNQVTACDSSAVALLIKWWGHATKQKKKITFSNLPKEMMAIMKLSNVDDLLKIST